MHPTLAPPSSHLQGPPPIAHLPPLPQGWTTGFSDQYQIPYYVDLRGPSPVSHWIHPYAPGGAIERELRAYDDNADSAYGAQSNYGVGGAGYQSGMSYGGLPHAANYGAQQQQYGSGNQGYQGGQNQYGGGQSQYQGGGESQKAPNPAAGQSGMNWMQAGGVGLAGAGVGALATYEYEKHKQAEAFAEGQRTALAQERQREQGLDAEMARLRAENEQLRQGGGNFYPSSQFQGLGQPQHHEASKHHSHWGEAGSALAGAGVGALLEHEYEKHKQHEAFEQGEQRGRQEELRHEAALQAELQRVRAENERMRQQVVGGMGMGGGYNVGYPSGGYSQQGFAGDGRMGPYV